MRHGVDILVATPGRLLDLVSQKQVVLERGDDTDHRRSRPHVRHGLHPRRAQNRVRICRAQRQSMLFSATMPAEVAHLVARDAARSRAHRYFARRPITADNIDQRVYFVAAQDKRALLHELLLDKAMKRVIVFTRTKHGANKVAESSGARPAIAADAIHGNKIAERAPARAGRFSHRPRTHSRGHRYRRARHRHRRRHPCHQFRIAGRGRKLCPPHRPHRARGQRRHRDRVLRSVRARFVARRSSGW